MGNSFAQKQYKKSCVKSILAPEVAVLRLINCLK